MGVEHTTTPKTPLTRGMAACLVGASSRGVDGSAYLEQPLPCLLAAALGTGRCPTKLLGHPAEPTTLRLE